MKTTSIIEENLSEKLTYRNLYQETYHCDQTFTAING